MVFACMCEEGFGRRLPFVLLNDVNLLFAAKFPEHSAPPTVTLPLKDPTCHAPTRWCASWTSSVTEPEAPEAPGTRPPQQENLEDHTAIELTEIGSGRYTDFADVLKARMEEYSSSEEFDRVKQIRKGLDDVKDIMMENIERVS